MQRLSDQLTPVLALAAAKGVTDLVPGWLRNVSFMWKDDRISDGWMEPDAARLIYTGSFSAWLAGQGIVVGRNVFGYWWWKETHGEDPADDGNVGADYLSALLAAATARLAELPNKENA